MLEREIVIADEHSTRKPKQSITIKLTGGSPWYGYVWIGDVLFAIHQRDGQKYPTVTRQK